MKILVDADACPVKEIIIKIAKEFKLEVYMFIDTSHILEDDYAKVTTVDKANDSADFALANKTNEGDIAITNDYGLASMLLAKKSIVINFNGIAYTSENIDRLLFERHISKKVRLSGGGRALPHAKKRTKEDDLKFETRFKHLCLQLLTH